MTFFNLLAESQLGGGYMFFSFLLSVLSLVCMWKVFVKADHPGIAAIIPVYNLVVMFQIAGRGWGTFFLLLIPFVNIVVMFLFYIDFAEKFDKGAGFAIGLIFLPFIFLPILAFDDSIYVG